MKRQVHTYLHIICTYMYTYVQMPSKMCIVLCALNCEIYMPTFVLLYVCACTCVPSNTTNKAVGDSVCIVQANKATTSRLTSHTHTHTHTHMQLLLLARSYWPADSFSLSIDNKVHLNQATKGELLYKNNGSSSCGGSGTDGSIIEIIDYIRKLQSKGALRCAGKF